MKFIKIYLVKIRFQDCVFLPYVTKAQLNHQDENPLSVLSPYFLFPWHVIGNVKEFVFSYSGRYKFFVQPLS